jgi:hypothetical protein
MKSKKILNIVFYKFNGETGSIRQACIFYSDGTIRNVNYEQGIDACVELARELNITTKDAFEKLINKDYIHVVSGEELAANFNKYRTATHNETVENENSLNNGTELSPVSSEPISTPTNDNIVSPNFNDLSSAASANTSDDDEDEDKDEDDNDLDLDLDDDIEDIEDGKKEEKPKGFFSRFFNRKKEDVEKEKEEKAKKKGIFGRALDKIKKSKIAKRVTLCVVALAVGLGLYSCHARNTKFGQMTNSNIETTTNDLDNDNTLDIGDNSKWDDYSYEQLLEVTTNESQKEAMTNLGDTITAFNGDFADNYLESNKSIRAALSFDEIIALQQAYNDYDKASIKAIFNGADIKASTMTRNYKDASLQLMGAYVIETRENPVDVSGLITSSEGKEFYAKYQELFLQAKEATGTDKLNKVKAFYAAVKADFPVTEEVRTEGIAHADNYNDIESYKLAVTPMIAAAEMMYQNLSTDYTLGDSEIDFLNDIGLCSYANDNYERIETILLASEEDTTNPTYEQYKNAIESMLKEKNEYTLDDDHRDLSQLDAFQNAVNWHYEQEKNNTSKSSSSKSSGKSTKTSQSTSTKTSTTTTYTTETTREEQPIPADEKAKIDAEIEKENAEAKKEAEEKAEEVRKELQEEADKEAEEIKKEIAAEEKDLQDKIDSANKVIDSNNSDTDTSNDKKVNESDFGDHNVDFDDDHSDSNGNLDDSVKDITTDSTGYDKNDSLPDPNVTGSEFDKQAETTTQSDTTTDTTTSVQNDDTASYQENYVGTSSAAGQTIYEYEEEVVDDATATNTTTKANKKKSTTVTNDELVDAYLDSLINDTDFSDEDTYQYTK